MINSSKELLHPRRSLDKFPVAIQSWEVCVCVCVNDTERLWMGRARGQQRNVMLLSVRGKRGSGRNAIDENGQKETSLQEVLSLSVLWETLSRSQTLPSHAAQPLHCLTRKHCVHKLQPDEWMKRRGPTFLLTATETHLHVCLQKNHWCPNRQNSSIYCGFRSISLNTII